jgi:hypothetical protein
MGRRREFLSSRFKSYDSRDGTHAARRIATRKRGGLFLLTSGTEDMVFSYSVEMFFG